MQHTIDLERLSQVFTDHPWLAEALSNGAWWGNGDGTVQVVAPVEDPLVIRKGLAALAEALGCDPADALDGGVASAALATQLAFPQVLAGRRQP